MHVVFMDPPPKQTARSHRKKPDAHPWAVIAEQLRQRPGEWALCLREVAVNANAIHSGKIKAFQPAGAFTARTVQTHKRDDRARPLIDLYIKYVGEPDGSAV